MNDLSKERIKELFQTAAETYQDSRVSFMEKFAELIIKECIGSIEKTINGSCSTDAEKMGCEYAITDLTEHFGVE